MGRFAAVRTATGGFAAAVAGSHQMVTRVDVLLAGATVAEDIAVIAGEVTHDRTAAHLGRLVASFAEPDLVPSNIGVGVLTPYGYELKVWRGIELGDGPELLPLGVFPIQQAIVDGVTLVTTVTAEDRSRRVSDARFEDDYQIAAGTNYATAIEALIDDGVPGLTYNFPSTTHTTPLLTFAAQSDRWEAAQKMASSIGQDIYFDGDGNCTMRDEPAISTEPVMSITEAANLVAAELALDRATAYNRVVATSTNAATGAVYTGTATDDDPTSPTYYSGPFGAKPRFYYSEFLASDAQAASAAAAILAANQGVARATRFAAVPDPRLEAGDVVWVTRDALNIDQKHVVDAVTLSLAADGPMTVTSRTGGAT